MNTEEKKNNNAHHSHHEDMNHSHHEDMNHSHHEGMDHSHHEEMDHSHHEGMDHSHHEGMNHSHHEGMDHSHHGSQFKQKFIVSLFLGIPILILSPMMGVNLPFQFSFNGSDWVVAVLATLLFFYGGMPFIQGAKAELKKKQPGMMMLITLGITVAYVYSLYAFVMNTVLMSHTHIMDFFWELASLILIMLLGHWIEMEAVTNAGNALQKMAELLPKKAWKVLENGQTQEMSLSDIMRDDIVLVKAGERVPADGDIIEGETTVNESLITGEAKHVAKSVGLKVIGGSVNGSGSIKIRVTGTGETGYLAQVMNLVANASKDKSRVESLADTVAKWLFYVALIAGVLTLILWSIFTSFSTGVERSVAVLVIACPHALGLAIPLVTARSTSIGAQNGVLVKSRQALESAQNIDVVMMDKTGTLTEGNFSVSEYQTVNPDYTKEQILQYFASLEQASSHPLAIGILNEAHKQSLKLLDAVQVVTLPGIGLEGNIHGKIYRIVSASYLDKNGIVYDIDMFNTLSKQGHSISYLLKDMSLLGWIAQGDQIKSDSIQFINDLKALGITPVMLTGDNRHSAAKLASILNLETYYAELMPEDKERIVSDYKSRGHKVLMVGDGVNDAPSLVRADVGVAIGAGTDIAVESADVILVKSSPSDIVHFISLAKRTTRKMKQNLWWGAGYNIVAIPLAAGALANFGIILSPAVGAVLMSMSTIIVAINAMFLRIKK